MIQIKQIFLYLIGFLFFSHQNLYGQSNKNGSAKFSDEEFILDGIDNEKIWESSEIITNFNSFFPIHLNKPSQKTEIKIVYDKSNIYVFAKCFTSNEKLNTPSLERDNQERGNEGIAVIFDTYKDGNNGFWFESDHNGVKKDALLSNGGQRFPQDLDFTWDISWDVKTSVKPDFYTMEFKIPFNSIKFPEDSQNWNIQFIRIDSQKKAFNLWSQARKGSTPFDLAFFGELIFDIPLGKSKSPLVIIPYSNGQISRNYEDKINSSDFSFGGDAKISIGNGMNLDLTFNPDFSQVEVDDQIINLTRFEVNLPEKRQFFIQNNDLFANFGDSRDSRAFFSRRIGVAKDLDGNTMENRIIAGLRLSGKISNNLRLGFLNMQTDQDLNNGISANNNLVLTLQQKVFTRSNIGLIYINRQKTGNSNTINNQEKFNRVLGLDYNLLSKNSVWTANIHAHNSFSETKKNNPYSIGSLIIYNTRNNNVRFKILKIGEGYESDLGFVMRNGIYKNILRYQRRFWVENEKLRLITLSQLIRYIDRPHLNSLITDRNFFTTADIELTNRSSFSLSFQKSLTYLENDFNITRNDNAVPLPPGEYNYHNFNLSYSGDNTRNLSINGELSAGKFYNGNKFSIQTKLNYRIQPIFQSSLNISYDKISLPKPYDSAGLWLIGPKINFTFTKKLFWSNYVQYTSISKNLGINSRLQWRFAPLSDLYLVYNDNYFASDFFAPKVRSLTFKLSYWINI